MLISYKNITRT